MVKKSAVIEENATELTEEKLTEWIDGWHVQMVLWKMKAPSRRRDAGILNCEKQIAQIQEWINELS